MHSDTMTTRMQIDLDMLEKYDRPGPRYTSYPTAPQFNTDFQSGNFLQALSSDADQNRGLSLYMHLPFCRKLCYFCGCTMLVTHNQQRIAGYLDYLLREIDMLAKTTRGRTVEQIHWGGGTPTYLSADQIRQLGEAIHKHYAVAPHAEIGVEIDPREMTEDRMQALKDVGFNRLSMGVQDFHAPTQQAINRIQPEAMTRRWVESGRDMQFESINLDFIYGLPHQTPATFETTLQKLLDIRPERLALFNYAHVPWMKKHQRVIDEATLPSATHKLHILKLAIETLMEAGYVFIGMDHFALPDDDLSVALANKSLYRNFQGYSTHADCDIIAHGMSGISQTERAYAQNFKDFKTYFDHIDRGVPATERGYALDDDDVLRREVITKLMCDFSLNFKAIEAKFGIDFHSYFHDAMPELEPFVLDGLLKMDHRGIEVSPEGRLVIRNIAMPFDKYLKINKKTQFSRTV